MKFYFVSLITIFSQLLSAQVNDGGIRLKTLQKSNIGKKYVYGKWNKKGGMETHLTYLGNIKTKKGKTYKIMTSVWLWGLSKRATNRILIFKKLINMWENIP